MTSHTSRKIPYTYIGASTIVPTPHKSDGPRYHYHNHKIHLSSYCYAILADGTLRGFPRLASIPKAAKQISNETIRKLVEFGVLNITEV